MNRLARQGWFVICSFSTAWIVPHAMPRLHADEEEGIDQVPRGLARAGQWNTICTTAYDDHLVQTFSGFCASDIVDEACEETGKLGMQMNVVAGIALQLAVRDPPLASSSRSP